MLPSYLTPFILLSATLIALAVAGLLTAASRPVPASPSLRGPAIALILSLVAWLLAAIGLGLGGVYVASPGAVPTIEVGIFLPILLGIGMYLAIPAVRELVDRLPQAWLIGLQLYRAGGAIFIVLWSLGMLPGLFAWPAGLGDVLVGISAPMVALAYWRLREQAHAAVWAWNLLGLLDLATSLTLGFLTTPSRFQLFALDAPNLLVTQFPLVIIPTFIVPLSILLHLASLSRLSRKPRP